MKAEISAKDFVPSGARSPTETSTAVKRIQVAVLFDRVGPYHFARLKAAGARIGITAVEFSNVDVTYKWDLVQGQDCFERVVLFPDAPVGVQTSRKIVEAVSQTLNALRPAAVAISGWYDRCSLASLRWCGKRQVPVIVMSESTAWDSARKPWREYLKKRVVSLCSAGLAGGKSHSDYLAQLGMDSDRIFMGYDAVDNDHFASRALEIGAKKSELRNQLGLPENFFLASARFVEKKNLSRLIQAYGRYCGSVSTSAGDNQGTRIWDLVVLGDGPLASALEQEIRALGLQGHIHLPGFKQYAELPVYYGLARVFIHASTTEQWGLVVNEAMASGLPVLLSNRCGCAGELIREGVNGYSFDPYNVAQMAELMVRMAGGALDEMALKRMGQASQEIISGWGPERFAQGLLSAVETAVNRPRARMGMFENLLLRGLILKSKYSS
jgi:1,2-diacylglycerol 3-alpha-glucosyltransferase